MDVVLAGLSAQVERPQTQKFAWPIVMLPELFTTRRHLAMLLGYFASIGWEVYALDLHLPAHESDRRPAWRDFAGMLAAVEDARATLERDAIIMGHGLGGLLALKLAERPHVRAAVALAPLVPGFASPLFMGARNRLARWLGRSLKPPTGKMLFELIADADAFQRDTIIRTLVPGASASAHEVARGAIAFARLPPAHRLIVAGAADIFAPADRMTHFAETIGARLLMLQGRGHWLISGRVLARVVSETQRFLVRALGQELLLLYPDELKDPDGGNGGDA
jgi:pimeloyl-ACP methyl ester carboxylesterase